MRLVTASTGKRELKISRSDWESIGRYTGWLKTAQITDQESDLYKGDAWLYRIPTSVFREIADYIAEVYRQIVVNNIKKITPTNVPPRVFNVDFSNTYYRFLNNLAPRVEVSFTLDKSKSSYFTDSNSTYHITINLKESKIETILSWVLEHEMAHFIQYLVREFRMTKDNIEEDEEGDLIGGLPPSELVDPSKTVGGESKGYYEIFAKGWKVMVKDSWSWKPYRIKAKSPEDAQEKFIDYFKRNPQGPSAGALIITKIDPRTGRPVKSENPQVFFGISRDGAVRSAGDYNFIKGAVEAGQIVAKETTSSMRAKHTNRPIEHYPDLNTVIRNLQYVVFVFRKLGTVINKKELFEMLKKSVESVVSDKSVNYKDRPKKCSEMIKYYLLSISTNNNGARFAIPSLSTGLWTISDIMLTFRVSNPKLYNHVVSSIETEFVSMSDKDIEGYFEKFHMLGFRVRDEKIEHDKQEAEKKSKLEAEKAAGQTLVMKSDGNYGDVYDTYFDVGTIRISYDDAYDYLDMPEDFEDVGYAEVLDEIMDALKIKSKWSESEGGEVFSIRITFNSLVRLMKAIKEKKTVEQSRNWYPEVIQAYDYFIKKILETVKLKMREKFRKTFNTDMFYKMYYEGNQ